MPRDARRGNGDVALVHICRLAYPPSVPKAQRYHHGNLRRAILDAALSLFAARGSLDFTMRELARHAGVTHNAPYRHFAGKDELRAALAAEGYELLRAALVRAEAGPADPRRRVRALGVGYVRFAVAHPHHFRLMVTSPLGPGAAPELTAAAAASFAVLRGAIEKGGAAGSLRADIGPGEVSLVAWALVHGLASLLVGGQLPSGRRAVTRFAALAEQLFFEGAGRDSAARGRKARR
jgi:AcrR family transcriptional regulator